MIDAVADDRLVGFEGRQAGEQHHLRHDHREIAELLEPQAARGQREGGELHQPRRGLTGQQQAGIT
jgi:hypothetical protein